MEVIAHRGASGIAPENSAIAIEKASKLGAKWVEFDVLLTRDFVPVVFHDLNAKRLTGIDKEVPSMLYKELKKLDVGRWFDEEFKGIKILTLVEMLALLKKLNLKANVELKTVKGNEKILANAATDIINHEFTNHQVMISSFSPETLSYVREKDEKIPLGLIYDIVSRDFSKEADKLDAMMVAINEKTITEQIVEKIRSSGYLVFCYVVNDKSRAKELFEWGVSAIYSDYPDLLIAMEV